MKEENGYKCVETIKELKQHIGDVITLSYINKGEEVVYMKKLTRFLGNKELKDEDEIPDALMVFGTHLMILKSQFKFVKTPCIVHLDEERMSNRFSIIRIPTKEEMNVYRNKLRYVKIFRKKYEYIR